MRRAVSKAEKQSQCLSFSILDALPRLKVGTHERLGCLQHRLLMLHDDRPTASTLPLTCAVVGLVQASVELLPPTMLAGEVRKCTLKLRNTGSVPLRGIRVVCSSPEVFLPMDDADVEGGTLESLAAGSFLLAAPTPASLTL